MKRQLLVPALYLAFALFAWGDFVYGYHKVGAQALDNLGLVVVVLPLAVIDVLVAVFNHGDAISDWSNWFHEMGLPQGFLWDHAYYYFPRVLVLTLVLFSWQRRRPRDRTGSNER